MSHYLPPAIMAFFRPRPPLLFLPTIQKKGCPQFTGIAQYVHRFNDPLPEPKVNLTPKEIKEKRKKKKAESMKKRLEKHVAKWDPKTVEAPSVTSEAYKTLFVARLNYDVTEEDLKNEFEYYGTIVKVRLVADKKDKSRGYGFVEFESSHDLKEAYNDADGRKVNGRRIVVDVERGRTVKNWKPRRLGGGLGSSRLGGKDVNQRFSGRAPPSGEYRARRRRTTEPRPPRDRREDKVRDNRSKRSPPRDRDRERRRDRDRGRSRDREDRGREDRGREDRGRKRPREDDRERRDRDKRRR